MGEAIPAIVPAVLSIALAAVHLWAGKLRFLDVIPRSRWLSLAGGASVGYVFVHLLPELSAGQRTIESAYTLPFVERHAYLIALTGLILFYGLERAAKLSRARRRRAGQEDTPSAGVFRLHIGSFLVYNLLIGYLLLHREVTGFRSLLLFFAAMALHFLVNDHGLRGHFKRRYDDTGRWVLAAAVVAGWAVGTAVEVHRAVVAMMLAFLAGGMILNVLKEELPEERESRFTPFLAGALAYTAVVLAQ